VVDLFFPDFVAVLVFSLLMEAEAYFEILALHCLLLLIQDLL